MRQTPPFPAAVARPLVALLTAPNASEVALDSHLELEQLFYIARYHQVAPAAWMALRNHPAVTEVFKRHALPYYLENVDRNARHSAALQGIAALLHRQDIPLLALKGACQLLDPLVGHSGRRVMTDLDLLVPSGAAELVNALLLAEGFEAEAEEHDYEIHGPKLHRPSDNVQVEVHALPWPGADQETVATLFACAVPHDCGGAPLLLPCVRHRLLHNAIHAEHRNAKHLHGTATPGMRALGKVGGGMLYEWSRAEVELLMGTVELRQLLDFHELAMHRADDLDWPVTLAEAEQWGRLHDLQQWAWTAQQVLNTPLPEGVAVCRAPRPVVRKSYNALRRLKGK